MEANMERLFKTHRVRENSVLEGLWRFYPEGKPDEYRQVLIPSCVETYPGYENYRGIGVFEKEIFAKGNVRLCLKGVSHTAEVFWDGEKIGGHYNAYTPFEMVVKDVKAGKHLLRVKADNSCHPDSALHVINDYYNYGGITRPVIVEEVGEVWIRQIHVRPFKEDGIWHGEFSVRIENLADDKRQVGITLDLESGSYLQAFSMEKETITLQPGLNQWKKVIALPDAESYELDAPKLYQVWGRLWEEGEVVDDLIDRMGFREIKVQGNRVYFNDKPVRIKGFNRHEDHALFGCAIPVEGMDYDLRLMEEMGANAVRTCHYPNDERFLDLCDEKGILVWEEGHARGLDEQQMRHPNFRKQSLDCLKEMVENHYNHPSIFTWGILNECASETEYGREVYGEQYALLRKLDKSRPLTSATCRHFSDICLDLPDIVSVNIYPGWYFDEDVKGYLEKIYGWVQETEGKGKPFLVSEIGAGGISGYHAPHRPKWSEERQCDILKEQLLGVLGFEAGSGVFIWQFCDGRVPDENFGGRPCCQNNKGIVDGYRRRKLAFETVKEIFTGK